METTLGSLTDCFSDEKTKTKKSIVIMKGQFFLSSNTSKNLFYKFLP